MLILENMGKPSKNINGNMDTLLEGQALFPKYIPIATKHIDSLISSDHE